MVQTTILVLYVAFRKHMDSSQVIQDTMVKYDEIIKCTYFLTYIGTFKFEQMALMPAPPFL